MSDGVIVVKCRLGEEDGLGPVCPGVTVEWFISGLSSAVCNGQAGCTRGRHGNLHFSLHM